MPGALFLLLTTLAGGALAYVFRRWRALEIVIAVAACAIVVLLLANPIDVSVLGIDIDGRLNLLGRSMRIAAPDRLPLLLLHGCALVLMLASLRTPENWTYIPVGLLMLGVFTAMLTIRPFEYAGLSAVIAGALGALMIQADRSGEHSTLGARRFLVVNALALPMFLGAGYLADRAAAISDPSLIESGYAPAAVMLVAGLALVMGAVPVFTWIHPVANDAPPLTTAFLATIGTGAAGFLLLALLSEFRWLSGAAGARTLLDFAALALLIMAAALGWAQRSLSRVLACGVLASLGGALAALKTMSPAGIEAASFGMIARTLSLGLFGIGVALLRERYRDDAFDAIRGAGSREAWLSIAIGVGGLSMAGLPGTIGFVTLWTTTHAVGDADLTIVLLLASLSIATGVLRGMSAMFDGVSQPTAVLADQERSEQWTVAVGVLLVFGFGLYPSLLSGLTQALAQGFAP
jgi:NADH:ubiquinone oxidoreductase subunit 2 (subunit N)